MKFTRRTCSSMILIAAAASNGSKYASAFVPAWRATAGTSTSSTSFLLTSRSAFSSLPRSSLSKPSFRSTSSSSSTSTSLMVFGNLLSNLFGGGGGGAYSSSIAYENLDFPGPELAAAAKNGQVLSHSNGPAYAAAAAAASNAASPPLLTLATFAGGCFWGLELAYQRVPGVAYTAVGYTHGPLPEPNYSQVCSGSTGHTEAIIVYYDPNECSYETLLDTFFGRVDPTTVNGQGNDYGTQYRTGVYYHTPEQEQLAKARFQEEATKTKGRRPIASELKPAAPFWPAEKYHQQYLEKGGGGGRPQSAAKGATETIRCYG